MRTGGSSSRRPPVLLGLLCLLVALAAVASAQRETPLPSRIAGFEITLASEGRDVTTRATVVVPFAQEKKQSARVNLHRPSGRVTGGRLDGPCTLGIGGFTLELHNAWYDSEKDCFQGAGLLRGKALPVRFEVGTVVFDASGIRHLGRLLNQGDWLLLGVVFDPQEATWEGRRIRFRGRLAVRPYPEITVWVGDDEVSVAGPTAPVAVLVNSQPVVVNRIDAVGDRLEASGLAPTARGLEPFTGRSIGPEGIDDLPVPPAPPEAWAEPDDPPSPDPSPSPGASPGGQDPKTVPHLPGLERFESRWVPQGVLTLQMTSGTLMEPGRGVSTPSPAPKAGPTPSSETADRLPIMPVGFIKLPPPLDRVNVGRATVTRERQVHLLDPSLRMFWEHLYANVGVVFPLTPRVTVPVKLAAPPALLKDAIRFDGSQRPMVGAPIEPIDPAALPQVSGQNATPRLVRADAHEADFFFRLDGRKDVELFKLGPVRLMMRIDEPYDIILSAFDNGVEGFKIDGTLKSVRVWLEAWELKFYLVDATGASAPLLVRYTTAGFMQVRALVRATFHVVAGVASITNPSLGFQWLPRENKTDEFGNPRGSLACDKIEILGGVAKIDQVTSKFCYFKPTHLGFSGSGRLTVDASILNYILELPDNAPVDLWFGVIPNDKPLQGACQLHGRVGVNLGVLSATATDPIAWLRFSQEAYENKKPLVDSYMKARVRVGFIWVTRVLSIWWYLDGRSDWDIYREDEPIPVPRPDPFPGPDDGPLEWNGPLKVAGLSLPGHFKLFKDKTMQAITAVVSTDSAAVVAEDAEKNRIEGQLRVPPPEGTFRNLDITSNSLNRGARLSGSFTATLKSRAIEGGTIRATVPDRSLTMRAGGEARLDQPVPITVDGGPSKEASTGELDIILVETGGSGRILLRVTYQDGQVDEYYCTSTPSAGDSPSSRR